MTHNRGGSVINLYWVWTLLNFLPSYYTCCWKCLVTAGIIFWKLWELLWRSSEHLQVIQNQISSETF